MASLRYIDQQGQLQTRSLDRERLVLGRGNTCEIVFDDEMISREHLAIEIDRNGRFRVRDLGSRNKTYVNGELIAETLLSPGDILRAGEHILEFLDEAPGRERLDLEFLTPDRSEPPHSEWIKTRAAVSLTVKQLAQLSLLGSDQPLTARAEDVADAAIGQILLDLQAERGLIAMRGENKMELRPLAHRALKRAAGASLTPVSQSFVFAPVLQSVAGRYPQTASQIDAKAGYAATAVVAPLIYRDDVIGILYADRPKAKKPFLPAAMQYALAAGVQLGSIIGEGARKLSRTAVREGAAWMSALRRLQASLSSPVAASDTFEAVMKRYPGRARCGDLADVIYLDEQRCAALVTDAGGHGISGVVQAQSIRAAIRAGLLSADDAYFDPSLLFNEISRMLASSAARQVVPCTFFSLDLSAGKLTYINAGGMAPLLMVGPGRLVTLDEPSLILGVDPDYVYEPSRVDLPESFRVICHTDGLTEAASVAGEPLGEQRLHDTLLDRETFASVDATVNAVDKLWQSHLAGSQPDDDALLLVVGRG